ncbi:MAG: hypothetical protein JWM80_2942 [Cyanobacteria bacterium RYN_339]|nr:hypothetical protein [Cyanobacteria bacterium RYN_339]
MPWGWFESEEDKRAKAKQARTVELLNQGKLPPHALHRLNGLKRHHEATGFFLADLSPSELLLSQEAGYESLGVVMGTAVYKVGWNRQPGWVWPATGVSDDLTRAHNEVRRLALARLTHEAQALGAHGVIGVRIQMQRLDWAGGVLEYMAIGTAIRIPGRATAAAPFTSNLSGQEFWALHQAGYWPRGLVYGICCYYVAASWNSQRLERGGWFSAGNQEVTQFTDGMQVARRQAMAQLRTQGDRLGADYVVDAEAWCTPEGIERSENVTDLLITFFAKGTAIALEAEQPPAHQTRPLTFLDLNSGKQSTLTPREME